MSDTTLGDSNSNDNVNKKGTLSNKDSGNGNFGNEVNLSLKKKNIIGRTKTTVKKYLDQVICRTGNVALKYFANPSIIGNITQADKLKIIAFIKKNILKQKIQLSGLL